MTTYTVQVTYEVEIEANSQLADGVQWIEEQIYQTADIGLDTLADIVELVIE